MQKGVEISVLVPIYNAGKYAAKCFKSLLEQTICSNVEIVVVDDCSIDDSIRQIKDLISISGVRDNVSFKFLSHQKNRGVAAARITALENATGEYVIYIDGDDYIEPCFLEQLYVAAKKYDADMVMSDVVKEYSGRTALLKSPYDADKFKMVSRIIMGNSVYFWNKLIRRELLAGCAKVLKEGYNNSEDYAVIVQACIEAGSIAYVPEAVYHYVQYNTNSITKNISLSHISSWLYSVGCVSDYLNQKGLLEYTPYMNFRKLTVRYWCMMYTDGYTQKRYSRLFPEIEGNVKSLLGLAKDYNHKLMLYFVLKGNCTIFNLLKRVYKVLRIPFP